MHDYLIGATDDLFSLLNILREEEKKKTVNLPCSCVGFQFSPQTNVTNEMKEISPTFRPVFIILVLDGVRSEKQSHTTIIEESLNGK